MAIIGKIREKSVLLVIIIGIALLAFILGDWQSFSGGTGDQIGYGSIGGERVDFKKYEESAANFTNQDKQKADQEQKEFTQKDQELSNDKAWNYVVESTILNREIDALGLNVGKAEFDAYLFGQDGFPVMQELAENFKDSATGLFNPKMLQQRIEQMETSKEPKDRAAWEESKAYYIERRKQEKYFAVLNQGVYITKLEAEEEYMAQKEVKSISFVARRFSEIPDTDIKVSDDELKAYYEEHKNEKQYENKFGSREITYFDVSVKPSQEDILTFNAEMSALKTKFAATTNDSLFVVQNSDPKFRVYSSIGQATFRPEGDEKARGLTYPLAMDTIFKSASVGQVVGPYMDNGNTRIAKVIGFNTNLLKARHILLSAPKADSAKVLTVRKTADSLVALINKDNFAEYVTRFSEDPGSKDKGGVYEDFMDYEMVPEFSNFAKTKPVGTIGVVQTDYGFHIMEAMQGKSVRFPELAVVQQTMKPSAETISETESEVYDMLYKLDAKLKNKKDTKSKLEAFQELATKNNFLSRPLVIAENKPVVNGFNTKLAEDKLIKLAYDDEIEEGALCSAPIKDKDRYIIAMVSSIKEAGVPTLSNIETQIRAKVIEKKKAERFTAQMSKKMRLEDLAKKLKIDVEKAEVVFANPQMGQGYEPEIIGALFSNLKTGKTTVPLTGKGGVYVVRINKTTKAPATTNFKVEAESLLASNRQMSVNLAKAALIDKANVVDNRRFLAIGLRR